VNERRKFERFTLKLPTRIELLTEGEDSKTLDLVTRDVSAGGAFFRTDDSIATGTKVKLRLIVFTKRLKVLTDSIGCVLMGGIVVRSEPTGMAICFDEKYRLVRLSLYN
jgi:c-di-GMP-binding flagellar brake protein YcgR